jgi:acetyl-CoA synthetase
VASPFDLARLLHPSSVAVFGASERPDTYSRATLENLAAIGFAGEVWGVNPRYERVLGRDCFPSLSDLPAVPDAVVIAIPAAGVPGVVAEARGLGCGGAVVYAAGFEEAGAVALADELRAAAGGMPVCGPNCDGLIALHSRVALWGDAFVPPEPGPVALVSQSGNLVVNALGTRRGLRLHTAVSSGNETVVTTADWLSCLAGEEGVRSVALLLEADGDGPALCEALARCADAGVGVAVVKVGASAAGAGAAAAHTGAVAGDHRVFRALIEEAGAAWADDVHELLEVAKALAVRARRPSDGLAILTCSGGDSGLGADEATARGLALPPLAPPTIAALRERLPAAATVANPLDYTAIIWGERETLREIVRLVGEDPGIGQVLVFYDRPPGLEGHMGESWEAVRDGILDGAAASPAPVLVAATLPELLDDADAVLFADAGVPAIAGLRTGVACAAALTAPPADAARLRAIAAAARRRASGEGRWLAEHEAKALLRDAGVPVVEGALAAGEDEAVAAAARIGGPVAVKLSSAALQHKTEVGALALGVAGEEAVREAWRRLAAAGAGAESPAAGTNGAAVLVERMAPHGVELLVSARTDAVVPALIVGLGGTWTELLDDVAIVPLPATPERAEQALRSLRGARLLTREPADLVAAAELAAAIGEAALAHRLSLVECNPVLVHRDGAVVVDAIAKENT